MGSCQSCAIGADGIEVKSPIMGCLIAALCEHIAQVAAEDVCVIAKAGITDNLRQPVLHRFETAITDALESTNITPETIVSIVDEVVSEAAKLGGIEQ